MVLTLYKLGPSPPVRAVMMTIEALKIPDVEYIDVNLLEGAHMKDEFMEMNPQRTIPMLKDDDFVIWDSHAIGMYLIGKYAQNDSLYPTDLRKRAVVNQRLHFDSGILFPALQGTHEPIIFWRHNIIQPEKIYEMKKAYGFTEKFLTADWLAGDDVTLADICCVASISAMNELVPIDRSAYPNISSWIKRCSKQEFYKIGSDTALLRAILKSKLEGGSAG